MKKIYNIKFTKQKGFTLLFAVLLSSLIVSIGASIISITLRQTILSGTSRESNYAFYAANTILECATYWDKIGVSGVSESVFPDPAVGEAPGGSPLSPSNEALVSCSGVTFVGETGWDQNLDTNITTFEIEIDDLTNTLGVTPRCAQATVEKSVISVSGTDFIRTRIEARGYNTCNQLDPRRVERGIIQEYRS